MTLTETDMLIQQAEKYPSVTEWTPTANGQGRLFKMEPGRKVVLESLEDQWKPNEIEDFSDQTYRVFFSPEERERRAQVSKYYEELYSRDPDWKRKIDKYRETHSGPYPFGMVR